METGEKYRIISKVIPGMWNKPREMIYIYIGESDTQYMWSARPLAGTQTLDKNDVRAIYEVSDDTPIMLPRIHRGETRVL